MRYNRQLVGSSAMAMMVALTLPSAAHSQAAAQSAADGAGVDDIVVTARKHDETSISVPVVLSAIGAAELERRAIVNVDSLSRVMPAVAISDTGSGIQGGIVSIRGLSGADLNTLGDQAVAFSIDGVQIAKSTVRRMGEFDMAQIEVLKGPQTLYFGKNSPAGVISIRTADPTSTMEAGFSTSYESEARQVRATGFVSGPLSSTLGIRLAGYGSDMKGWMHRDVPATGTLPGTNIVNVFGVNTSRAPATTEYGGRVTLKWEPSPEFDARLKVSFARSHGGNPAEATEIVHCGVGGVAQGGSPADNCFADGHVFGGNAGPSMALVEPAFGNGSTYLKAYQFLSGLEMNWRPSDQLTITSVTGLYSSHSDSVGNFTLNYLETQVPPKTLNVAANGFHNRELSQEIRVRTSFDSPFNFMVGGYYQNSRSGMFQSVWRNVVTPTFVTAYIFEQKGEAYSVFGQGTFDILPTLELAGGGRWSHEKKTLPVALNRQTFASGYTDLFGPNYLRSKSWSDFSPEVSLSYRPNPRLTLFASYKQGFLSGGYNANTTAQTGPGGSTLARSDYDPQKTRGFEAGVKALLLDGTLRTNLSAYTYKTTGLQVSVTTSGTVVELKNAASVRTSGAEFDFNWKTPVEGLLINGGAAYTNAHYIDYQASCYRAQSSTTCFNQVSRLSGATALLQDLSGQDLPRAPRFGGSIGFDYQTPVGANLQFGLSGNITHSSKQWTDYASNPDGILPAYDLIDAGVRVGAQDKSWELAFIGKNLTNKFLYYRTATVPFTGSAPGAAVVGVPGDTSGFVNRGRELWVKLTVNFGK